MSLDARICEERARLALAKERLRGRRRDLGLASSTISSSSSSSSSSTATESKGRLELNEFSANRRFEYRSPRKTARGVSVRVTSCAPATAPAKQPQTPASARIQGREEATPRRKALHNATAREAALAAKASLHERKLAFAERELTAKADLLETLSRNEHDLTDQVQNAREEIEVLRKDKLDLTSERDVARKRVYALSERVSSLEKKLKKALEDGASRADASSNEAHSARTRVQVVERELAAVRATLGQTRERLENCETSLEDAESRATAAEERAREFEERCSAAEEAFSAENLGRQEYSDKCRVLEQECASLRAAFEGESGEAKRHETALAKISEQLAAERERASALEAQLKSSLEEARKELEAARRQATEALECQARAEERAKAAEAERSSALTRFQDQFQHMHEQFARTTLTVNAETDALRREAESLRAQLAEATRKHVVASSAVSLASSQVSSHNLPLRENHPAEIAEVEELLVDVDLPNGDSAELVVRSTDDPAEAIAAFSVTHALSPRVAAHLEEYVCAQLRRAPVPLSREPSRLRKLSQLRK
ncbi:Hypothetical Protein FCC1311_070742 [Hondaea fermentalgiana]|uniref:Uncharacterized protein n=1 Tax=Hondaea fermentalgiana TaxID=2315210 RepID=A0A2R5GSJ8_9STRA|nr:Hypothetical Protein FCC1311_070742 [Hondaea fermentalgiana]|eukprot:GBG30854.1 Hypothetical Protein FCC1311_070742 [Hondaea fermentalgiana]